MIFNKLYLSYYYAKIDRVAYEPLYPFSPIEFSSKLLINLPLVKNNYMITSSYPEFLNEQELYMNLINSLNLAKDENYNHIV